MVTLIKDQQCLESGQAVEQTLELLVTAHSMTLMWRHCDIFPGVDESTPCPPGAVIEKYPDDHKMAGQLTGVLKDAAMTAAELKVEIKQEDRLQHIEEGLKYCLMVRLKSRTEGAENVNYHNLIAFANFRTIKEY